MLSNTLSFLKAATTTIRLNSSIKTLKSIYDNYGLDINEVIIAKETESISTISFFIKFLKLFLLEL